MTKDVILITRKLPDDGIKELEGKFELIINYEDRNLTREEIIEEVRRVNYLVPLLSDVIDEEVIEIGVKLRLIANYAVGYNNIDLKAATKNNIFVTNTPGVLTNSTADLTMALLLAVTRRIPESDKYCRDGKFRGWAPLLKLGKDLEGKTLGIIGMGRIGEAVARRSSSFGLKLVYHNRSTKENIERELKATKVTLDQLCRQSNFISIHVPLTESTKHLIGMKELEMMKRGTIIINTSRGQVIDENALIRALKNDHLGGVGLDVFHDEPFIPDSLKLPNVVLTPHTGSATIETRVAMAKMVSKNILAVSRGEIPPNLVNR
ncbi:MAG: 2-hydroxyacid dehydrogenase [Candidatus Hodarchaeales archaeon]|jgi:glyoxylate reductase